MNTPLAFRPVDVRLMIAYMVDAHYVFDACNADNSFQRATHDGTHPYHKMWSKIGAYYDARGWNEMSDPELRDVYKTYISTDTVMGAYKTITPMDVMRSKQRWNDRGWYRYEHKRDGRRAVGRRYGLMAAGVVSACFGVVLPTNG